MPFPVEFGRVFSDEQSLLAVLPEGTTLHLSVQAWRTFDWVVSVDRDGKEVWVVVYSALYPRNFDTSLPLLQSKLEEFMRSDGPSVRAFVYDGRRADFYAEQNKLLSDGLVPHCLSCFDCVPYVDRFGLPHGVNCDACGSDGGDGTPGERNAQGDYTLKFGVDPGSAEASRKCNACRTEMDIDAKRCGRCVVSSSSLSFSSSPSLLFVILLVSHFLSLSFSDSLSACLSLSPPSTPPHPQTFSLPSIVTLSQLRSLSLQLSPFMCAFLHFVALFIS